MLAICLKVLGALVMIEGILLFAWPRSYLSLWRRILRGENWQDTFSWLEGISENFWRAVGFIEAVIGLFIFNLGLKS